MPDIHGLLFDMDGLLLDTEIVGQLAFIEAMAPRGVSAAEASHAYLHFVGGNSAATHARMAEMLPGHDPKAAQDDWIAAFEARIAQGVPLKPTVVETVTALAAAGVPMAVVTSSWRAHAEHNLSVTGLLPFFEGIVPGDEVSRSKPDPEPYERGAALLGLSPQHCAAFEDSDPGITAAMAAGTLATQIPDLRPPGQLFPALGQRFATTLAEAVGNLGLLRAQAPQHI
ncbi:MAG: HAD family phosphatase [Pseudomonadota bacterium]